MSFSGSSRIAFLLSGAGRISSAWRCGLLPFSILLLVTVAL